MEKANRLALFALIGVALVLGVVAFDSGPWTRIALAQQPAPRAPAGTAFTYQGELKKNGALVEGNCYLQFSLYSDSGGTALVAGPVNGNPYPVSVSAGRFTVQIDFGSGAFQGDARWLKTSVKCAGESSFTALSLERLNAAPYSVYSLKTAPHSHLGDTWDGAGPALTLRSTDDYGLIASGKAGPIINPLPIGLVAGVYGESPDRGLYGSGAVGVQGVNSNTSSNYGTLGTPNYGAYGTSASGVGIEGINTDHGNFGDIGTTSSGVHGYGLGTNDDGVIGSSYNGGNGVSGAAFNGGSGVSGSCYTPGCTAVLSNGNTHVTGNLQVDGQATGFFPHPAYDSGFVYVTNCTTLSHNLGGNAQNYLVDITAGNSNGAMINNDLIGGYYDDVSNIQGWVGFWYEKLTPTSVDICTGIAASYIRLRIWVYK